MDLFAPVVRPYLAIFQSPLMLLFTALALLQLYNGVRRLARVRGNMRQFSAEPLQAWKQQVGEDIAFYIAVPVGVFLHELAHAIVVWAYGGRVVEFGFFFFWGYVLPDRVFPFAWQEWVLSSAGTWANLLFALAIWLWGRNQASSALRYAALRSVRFQIYFALIYYPLFTVFLAIGDWRTIYNFASTPLLSGITAVIHAALLLTFYWLDRRGSFEAPAFESAADARRYADLKDSSDIGERLTRAQLALRGRAPRTARTLIDGALRAAPDSGVAHYLWAAAHMDNPERVSGQTVEHARLALRYGLGEPGWRAACHHMLGLDALNRGNATAALEQFDQALAEAAQAAHTGKALPMMHTFYNVRSQALLRLDRAEEAERDLHLALQLAQLHQQQGFVAHYQRQLEALRLRGRKS